MDLTKIPFIPANINDYSKGRDGHTITHIVIHAMIGTEAGTEATFENPKSHVSAHYNVARDGHIIQMVHDQDKAWHVCNANGFCLGIEHEDLFKNNKGQYVGGGNNTNKTISWWTIIQLQNSAQLVAAKMKQYKIPINNVIGHNDPFLVQYGNNHQDPGVLFPWTTYKSLIQKYLEG